MRLQFIADSFYIRGLASKFVHLFISTLHFPNQVSPPSFCCEHISWCSFLGKDSRLQRPAALLDHRQWFCMSAQHFHIWWGEMIFDTIQQKRRISGWQDALWGAGCSETFPWSLWGNWWCGLQVIVPQWWWKENVGIVILHRKNIFIFLSNTGGKEITDAALSTWREGKPREEISFAQVVQCKN